MLRSEPGKEDQHRYEIKKRMAMLEWELQKTLELLTNVSASMRFLQQRVGFEAAT